MLSELSEKFSNNANGATKDYKLHITDSDKVIGVPKSILKSSHKLAKDLGKPGWLFSIDASTVGAILKCADDRDFRKSIYEAYASRVSNKGPTDHKYDNGPVMQEMIAIRQKIAKLMGKNNPAEVVMLEKSATTGQVEFFL